jgi:hypothetical protein
VYASRLIGSGMRSVIAIAGSFSSTGAACSTDIVVTTPRSRITFGWSWPNSYS